MHAAVELLYRDGIKVRPEWPSLVGQLFSGHHKGVTLLHLYPLEWVENSPSSYLPLATLWHPVMVRIGFSDLLFRGYEAVPSGNHRRWVTQKWICRVMSPQIARDYLRRPPTHGEVKPSV